MIRYLGTPSTPEIRHAMQTGLIDTMTGPYQGNILPLSRWISEMSNRPSLATASHPTF